jgi:hypothetical protein
MRNWGRTALGTAVAIGMIGTLAGCSSSDDKGSGKAGGASAEVAKSSGKKVGPQGSACEMPVTFELAAFWRPKPVELEGVDSDFAVLAEQGPTVMKCEIDAKPAGSIGFLRVYVEKEGTGRVKPRELLEGFVTGDKESRNPKYRDIKAGKLPAVEVTYESYSELNEKYEKERALAVWTSQGAVVVHLAGPYTEDYEEMLPAFELAKQTLAMTEHR